MCVPKNPPEVRLRLLIRRQRLRLRLRCTSQRPSCFSRRHLIAKPFATGRRCPQVVATRPSQSVSRTLCCETILSPRLRCILCVWSGRHLFGHLVPVLLKPIPYNCLRLHLLSPPWCPLYPGYSPRHSLPCRPCCRKRKTMKSSIR